MKKFFFKKKQLLKKKFVRFLMRLNPDKVLTFGYNTEVPQRKLAIGYLSYIIFGFLLLSLPFTQKESVSFIDNLFIVTSAISTTGLTTIDIGSSYTIFGQILILLLIQLGGLGYMTISAFIMHQLTKHFMRIKDGVMRTSFSIPAEFDMRSLIKGTIFFSIFFEVIGCFALFLLFKREGVEDALWNGIFHGISAFCTAGFSLFSDSLVRFNTNWGINLVIAFLSYAGALGFILMIDLKNKLTMKNHKLTFTSKIIFFISLLITLFGTVQLYFFEPSFQSFEPGDRLLISFFQTMSAMTTVGFNSVDMSVLVLPTLLTICIAMFVGSSPSGTGGGVKSTTISAVYAFVKCKLGKKRDVELLSRRLPTYRVDTALTNFIFYSIILFVGIYVLTFSESMPFEDIMFEATSALGTVGLSTGVSAQFTPFGKFVLILLMYIGRLGVLAFGTSMLIRMSNKKESKKEKADVAV